ncbi:hypothetical protein E4Z66_05080 [Aliishimia ponticola]|uniref:Tetratricopeptide repeat protein n=1 Tax=Aliishimia ponticola TaxID=2499833 RepID=A0A4S4NKY1_9RHOB|nr:hypothetical protein [Aliishimia ponticola]THH38931.1 hypothetical protein E4Z66_05080 [Aliishimia ponticola]
MDLNDRLLSAHASGDIRALITLYEEAANSANEDTARGFYLTHAYVFALEAGAPEAATLRARLVDMGREPRTA